jgi:hypothetical protein
MFVQDFLVIHVAYPDAVRAIEADAASILGDSTACACAAAEELRAKVGPAGLPRMLQRTVSIELSPIRRLSDRTLIGFRWQSTSRGGVFPGLEGDLEVAPFGLSAAELVVRGCYDPPGGILGREADRLLLHRVAESTVRALLHRVAERLDG